MAVFRGVHCGVHDMEDFMDQRGFLDGTNRLGVYGNNAGVEICLAQLLTPHVSLDDGERMPADFQFAFHAKTPRRGSVSDSKT